MDQQARFQLSKLLDRFGADLSQDRSRCRAMLNDVCPQARREISVLVAAVEEGLPAELQAIRAGIPKALMIARLTQKLEDERGLDRTAARWAVESWALALKVVTEAELSEESAQAIASPQASQVSEAPQHRMPHSPQLTSLRSGATGVDYTNLDHALRNRNWKEADELTGDLMLQVADRSQEGWWKRIWLNVESIRMFPGEDLKLIDRLWVEHSNGILGFSVQKRIWEECGCPGPSYSYNRDAWIQFGKKVNWHGGTGYDGWRYYTELDIMIRDQASPFYLPRGHLPLVKDDVVKCGWTVGSWLVSIPLLSF